jgi:Family of unknown function (DUF6141)
MGPDTAHSEEVVFREVQRFKQRWIWPLVLVAAGGAWIVAIIHFFVGDSAAKGRMPDVLMVFILLLIGIGLPLLFLFIMLVVEVRRDGLYYRFYPFHLSFHGIPYGEIKKVEARTYRPVKEYGGWGIRFSKRNGKAYNMSGDRGVQLELMNGKRVLFGSQQADELAAAIHQRMGSDNPAQ